MRKFLIAAALVSLVAGSLYWLATSPAPGTGQSARERVLAEENRQRAKAAGTEIKPVSSEIPDPRLTFETLFRNIRPDVKFVGDKNCAQCHEELCTSFHAHPMGRSAIEAGADSLEQYSAEAKNPCEVGPYQLQVRLEDGKMTHEVSARTSDGKLLPPAVFPVSIAIGSGTRGRSYLNVDGTTVWQSPISWFTTNMRWDVSPGYDLGSDIQRPTIVACLYCHLNSTDPVPESVNRFRDLLRPTQLAIGCERCHGPGELHADERAREVPLDPAHPGMDTSIVNPAHLPEDLQMSICGQCHLAGKTRVVRRGRQLHEFRPGLPLELFVNAFVSAPDAQFKNKAVGHFDQMLQSKCVTESGARLTCTACHDPHRKVDRELANRQTNEQCVACHVTQPCSAPELDRQKQNDNCIHCHMPQNDKTNIAHTSFTDHRILRSPSNQLAASNVNSIEMLLVPYAQGTLSNEENERDRGIALSRYSEKLPPGSAARNKAMELAKEKLTESLQRWPEDIDAWLALSTAYVGKGDANGALAAAENALKVAPRNEDVLIQVAFAAERAGKLEQSERTYRELIALNPASQDYRLKHMANLVASGDWYAADEASEELLRLNPVQPTARLVRGLCLYGKGEKGQGRREVEIAKSLATTQQQRAFIQGWFDRFVAWQARSQ